MKLYTTILSLQVAIKTDRANGLNVGFVPTMGALHEGHLSLVRQAGALSDLVVVSIFVNPNQFNDSNDLANYPRTVDKDLKLLSTVKCDYVFYPDVSEIYPVPDNRRFSFGILESVMEGKFRPGHFNGVAQVVSRLFDIVDPDLALFGRKDFQQLAVIKNLVIQLGLRVKIVACDIVREPDGLAMSSRNKLLLPEHREIAPVIYRTLKEAKALITTNSVESVKEFVINEINKTTLLTVEYFEIVDDTTLQSIDNWNEPGIKVGCIAVFAGRIRLIDNLIF